MKLTLIRGQNVFIITLGLFILTETASAGIRGPGRYSGAVIFDRWDGCIFKVGPYLYHVSESVKEKLRPYERQTIHIDITKLGASMDQIDAVVDDLTVLGSPPPPPDNVLKRQALRAMRPNGASPIGNQEIELTVKPAFEDGQRPVVEVCIRNKGAVKRELSRYELTASLIMKKLDLIGDNHQIWNPWAFIDGPSYVIISGIHFRHDEGQALGGKEYKIDDRGFQWYARLADEKQLPPEVFRAFLVSSFR